jgi:hypothetical protein
LTLLQYTMQTQRSAVVSFRQSRSRGVAVSDPMTARLFIVRVSG